MVKLIACLALMQGKVQPAPTSNVLPFIKAESVGFNPLNPEERILFHREAVDRMAKNFKGQPLVLVTQTESRDGKKATVEYKQVGVVSCIFVGPDQWVSASVESSVAIPKGYVLRARTRSDKNYFKDGVLHVDDASIIEFHLKDSKTATQFK